MAVFFYLVTEENLWLKIFASYESKKTCYELDIVLRDC